MTNGTGRVTVLRLLARGLTVACLLVPEIAVAQGLTGTLVGTVSDAAGGVISGAAVRISSPALIGGELMMKTDERGQLRFPSVPPGSYALEIVLEGFRPYRDADIRIWGRGHYRENACSHVGSALGLDCGARIGSRLDVRNPGFGTLFDAEDLGAIPMRRFSYQDWVKTAPGVSPTSPSGSSVLVSAFGSGVDQNQYLLDGTSITVQQRRVEGRSGRRLHSGAADPVGGRVGRVRQRPGRRRQRHHQVRRQPLSGPCGLRQPQPDPLTSQPVRYQDDRARQLDSGYERAEYRDFTTGLGGPVVRERVWFFSGYQHLRDSDSQAGTDPDLPREYEQDKFFAKLTWSLAPGWQLVQSVHDELLKPRNAVRDEAAPCDPKRLDASVPAINFGHLTHTASPNTVWDLRVGRFRFTQDTSPTSGDPTIPNRIDQPENIWSGGPLQCRQVRQVRTTVKATVSHYRAGWLGGDHEWRMGAQVDRGEHRAVAVLPTGESYVYRNGVLRQRTLQAPANSGGRFVPPPQCS